MALHLNCNSKVSVITIDQDDTLWDNTPTLIHAENTLYNWIIRELPDVAERYTIEDLKLHRQKTAEELPAISHDLTQLRFESLLKLCKQFDYLPDHAIRAMDIFLEARNHVKLYDDVIPFLDEATKDYRIVALSNGNADVNVIGLGHYFTMTVTASDVGKAKPEPDMFYHVVNELNVDAGSVLHIGDEPETDILGAQRSGIYNIWINRKHSHYPSHIPLPDMEIGSLNELLPHRVSSNLRKS